VQDSPLLIAKVQLPRCTAPADGITWPHAAQIMRIRRATGPTHGPWTHKEIAYGITSLPPDLAGPRHLAIYARRHWAIENREHHVRDKTFGEEPATGSHREPAQCLRRHPQPGHRCLPARRLRQHRPCPPLIRPR
jgi:hypothetical protein